MAEIERAQIPTGGFAHRKELPGRPAFADDDGSPDPHVTATLAAWRNGTSSSDEVLEALRGRRLLVPILAHARGEHEGAATVVGVTAPDGRVAMPVFTCVAELSAWHPTARPMPVLAEQAALAAIDENWQIMVIDPATTAFFVPRPAVSALMTGQPWRPAVVGNVVSDEVQVALAQALAQVSGPLSIHAAPGQRSEVMVIVTVDPATVNREQVGADVQAALAASPRLIELVDSFEVRFLRADSVTG